MKKVYLLMILIVLSITQIIAQKKFDEPLFKQTMDRYLANPIAFLSNEVSEDFRYTGRDGITFDAVKTKAIYDMITETDRIFENVNIRQNGSTVVVTGTITQKTLNKKSGKNSEQKNDFTYAFTQNKVKWILVDAQHREVKSQVEEELKSELIMEMDIPLFPPVQIGSKIIYALKEGNVKGKLEGKTLALGGDFGSMIGPSTFKLDVRLAVETIDKETIYITYNGFIHTDPETFGKLVTGQAAEVDPSKYYFRTNPMFETTSKKYDWLNHTIAVGVGRVTAAGVSYKVYLIK
ncbi:MAG: hypothetical protein CFE22_06830 [Cytophagaceae bacterium BCCC1]|nr:MAG: hypothetical protein CFE22_06830 [Cytophagaceae bacterium BCCC1]